MSREFEKKKRDMLFEERDWDSLLEDDDEFDAFVKEEYMKEAEEIERSLFPEGLSREPSVSEEETRASYEKLVALMKKRGIYREDDALTNNAAADKIPADHAAADKIPADHAAADKIPADHAAADKISAGTVAAENAPMIDAIEDNAQMDDAAANEPDSRKTIAFAGGGRGFVPRADGSAEMLIAAQQDSVRERGRRAMRRQFKTVRAAGVAVACMLGVLLASMTSEANRIYVVQRVKSFMGNGAYEIIDSASENDLPENKEAEIREEIENAIGVKVPEIMHRPDTFELYDYAIYEETATASIEYMYNGNIITLDIYDYSSGLISRNFGLQGDKQATFYIEEDNIQVLLTEIVDETENLSSYTAEWERENVLYQFSGRMEKEIFEDIVKSMKYY